MFVRKGSHRYLFFATVDPFYYLGTYNILISIGESSTYNKLRVIVAISISNECFSLILTQFMFKKNNICGYEMVTFLPDVRAERKPKSKDSTTFSYEKSSNAYAVFLGKRLIYSPCLQMG